MTTVLSHAVTVVHPGDVMLDPSTGHLVDVVTVSDTVVQCRDRANYSGPLLLIPFQDFVHSYRWVRHSPVLLSCNLDALERGNSSISQEL